MGKEGDCLLNLGTEMYVNPFFFFFFVNALGVCSLSLEAFKKDFVSQGKTRLPLW